MFEIKRAQRNELDRILHLYHYLINRFEPGNDGTDRYPSDKMIRQAIERGNIYVGLNHSRMISVMAIDHEDPCDFSIRDFQLSEPSDKVSVLYAMAVDPSYSGNGIGNQMVSYAIEQSRLHGNEILRWDVLADTAKTLEVYQNFGFEHIGQAVMDARRHLEFEIYEYKI